MPHAHAWVLVHCIFSTKERANLIPDPVELCRYLTGVVRAKNVTLLAAGGTANHIHLLIHVPPAIPLAKAIQELKGNSSRWLRQCGVRFEWQQGYGAFSVRSRRWPTTSRTKRSITASGVSSRSS